MQRIIARISNIKEATKHQVTEEGHAGPMPHLVSLTIVEEDGGYYLFRNDEHGVCISDTWHITPEEAKEQAEFEFGVEAEDWATD